MKTERLMDTGEHGSGSALEVKHLKKKEEVSSVRSLLSWGRKIRFPDDYRGMI